MPSAISGGLRIEFTGKPVTLKIPHERANHVTASVTRPKAYWIPPAWSEVVQRLELHGIQLERITEPRDAKVTMYRLEEMKFHGKDETRRQVEEEQPFEGRVQISARPIAEQRTEHYPAGSVRVPTNQPLGDLAAVLLEPASLDSFLQWGFFDEVFQHTEYIEGYVIAPLADRMLAENPTLKAEFEAKLAADPKFAADPDARLGWFYQRTPYYDERFLLYPIGRELKR